MSQDAEIAIGSRWKERDSRFERYVIVRERNSSVVRIESEQYHRVTEVRTEKFPKRFAPISRWTGAPPR